VTLLDLRVSRPIRVSGRQVVPQIVLFNVGNAATVVRNTAA
jgi:hypothetical protein